MKTLKSIYKSVIKSIKYFFFPRTNRMSKTSRFDRKIASHIRCILEQTENSSSIQQIMFTDIRAKIKHNVLHITVECQRPGLFIGKAGWLIDHVTKRLTEIHEKEVKIHLKEKLIF